MNKIPESTLHLGDELIKDLFFEYLTKRIHLLTESFIAVKSHETEIEAQELRVESKVLRRVLNKYLKIKYLKDEGNA